MLADEVKVRHWVDIQHLPNDTFSVDGLIAGRRYDLTFHGQGVRSLTITGVTAPADGLDVEMQARAKVSGAIGFPRGARCMWTP